MSAPFDAGNQAFRTEIRRFVAKEITPRVPALERAGKYPRKMLASCGRRGYLDLDAPRAAIFAEELVACDSMGVALGVFVQAGLIAPLLEEWGTPTQKKERLDRIRAGRMVGALAVTEPHAGSDIAGLQATAEITRTRATAKRAQLQLNGEKTYITSAAAADFLIVAARVVEDDTPDKDVSLVIVPADSAGVRITPLQPLGLELTAMGRVTLRNCRVPVEAIVGERGGGYGYILAALDRERLFGGIGAIAWAQRAIEKTTEFLRARRAFGRVVSKHQAVRHQLAECATALAAARQLNYAAYVQWVSGKRATNEIAMVKLFSYREAQRAVELCLQLHGGLGYMGDQWISRWYRDARALTIAAGTPEVMRDLIAAHLRL
ncbi:MAG TPA: acyl-CoA dehydrogenase family protein [Gemmatimonadaceae bacterium]|nr:acyl-CoA dehydrogenase family protein [Gemmatimonadaceae bacterium]